MKRPALVGAFVAGVLAAAVFTVHEAEAQQRRNGKLYLGDATTPVIVKGTLTVDGPAAGNDGGAGVTSSYRGKVEYDFPSLGGVGSGLATTITCADSNAVTVTGCGFGDQLLLGMDQVRVNSFITFTPYMTAADTAKVQACCVGINDAGSCDQPDSGFTVRCVK